MTSRKGPSHCRFEVRAHAGDAGHLEVASDAASVRIGQRIRRDGEEEIWDSLLIECREQEDGSLTVEVVVCHPDWEEPVRVASMESNPNGGPAKAAALTINLKPKDASI